jgi:hypothetical protein
LERSRLATVAFSGSYFGTVISLPLSGMLAEYMGWPYIFYLFGMSDKIDDEKLFTSKYHSSKAFLQASPILAVW